MLPSRTSARLSQFRLAMDKVLWQVFAVFLLLLSATKVSLVFVFLLFFSNCYFTFEICSALGRYRLQKLYRIFMAVVAVSLSVARCVAFIYYKRTRNSRRNPDRDRGQNRKPNRHELCERLRYFRFGHLPDYFVLCLRIGAGSDQWLMPK